MLAERLNLKPSDAVLDLCCGTGLDFPFLFRKAGIQGTLVGVDLSSEMLRQAEKRIEKRKISRRYGTVPDRLITKKSYPADFEQAFKPGREDIKTTICFKRS